MNNEQMSKFPALVICPFFSGENCSNPPTKPKTGTQVWDKQISFGSKSTYTCGPFAKFQATPNAPLYEEQVAICSWNKSWTPKVLPNCVATSCPEVPFPPYSTGMIYRPDDNGNFSLQTGEQEVLTFWNC